MNLSDNWGIWEAMAGLAFFLLGTSYIETQLKQLAGREFKLFVRKHSGSKLSAVGSAAVITGLLQSSSVVNLMILAFVGAGITGMDQALALMLGANLGTTLSTWFVASAGFKVNMEVYSLPLIAVAGIGRLVFRKDSKQVAWSDFILGLGFLFLGLSMMKTGVEHLILKFDFSGLSEYPSIMFLLLGIVLTGLIQSSSATAAIVLTALHAKMLNLQDGAAIVLGAEVGTTLKLILASLNGSAVKKRVALGNFFYNAIVAALIFPFVSAICRLIVNVAGVKDTLIALAFFQTLINIIGIVVFLPFVNKWAGFLKRLYATERSGFKYLESVPPTEIEFALTALQKEGKLFLKDVMHFSRKALDIWHPNSVPGLQNGYLKMPEMEQYEFIKHLHGDIFAYCLKMQAAPISGDVATSINRFISSVRNAMYAAKSIKDALPDIEQLTKSGNDTKYQFLVLSKQKAEVFYDRMQQILELDNASSFEALADAYKLIQSGYEATLSMLYKDGSYTHLSEVEISTIINFNRELYTSFKSLVFAVKDGILPEKDAAYFDELPGFIR